MNATSPATPEAASGRTFVYVSAATDGVIHSYGLDITSGALTPSGTIEAGKIVGPMAIAPDGKHLYAAVRSQPFRALTLDIDPQTGVLAHEAVAALPDSMPYVSTALAGRLLLAASYGGSKIASLPINAEGKVVDGARQVILTGRNAHAIVTDRSGRFVFVPTLGSDAVQQFVLDAEAGMLHPNDPPHVSTPAGSGPRHIIFSPDNRFAYVITELSGEIVQFALDAAKGTLSEVSRVSFVPPEAGLAPGLTPPTPQPFGAPPAPLRTSTDPRPKIWGADIGQTPDGRFLYASERTTSTIALLHVDAASGTPTLVGHVPTETQPRAFRIDPSGRFLIAAGEKADHVSVHAIAPSDGSLTVVARTPVSAGAGWVEIVRLD